MADTKISALTAATAALTTDEYATNQGGVSLKVTLAQQQTATKVADLLFTDATYDIGKSGLTRPRDLFLSRNATVGGTVTVTGGQITFPASQAASSGANVLDDYEEGTWTAVIGGSGGESGQVYTTQTCRYTKIGRLVHIHGQVTLSTLGTVTGTVELKGLPFTVGVRSSVHVGFWGGMTTSFVYMGFLAEAGATTATLYTATAAATGLVTAAQANLSNTSDFVFSATYSV